MRRIVLAIFILGTLFVWSCSNDPRNDACYDAALAKSMKDSVCVATCDGVCACNGVTYCNECEAMKAGYEVYPGDTIPCSQK